MCVCVCVCMYITYCMSQHAIWEDNLHAHTHKYFHEQKVSGNTSVRVKYVLPLLYDESLLYSGYFFRSSSFSLLS